MEEAISNGDGSVTVQLGVYPKPTTIFVDMDGVLVDFMGGCLALHGMPDLKITPGEWHTWKCMGITERRFWEVIDEKGVSFWSNLKPTPDGQRILAAAENAVGPDNVYLLSKPSFHPASYAGKRIWVEQNLPQYQRRLILTAHKHFLAKPDRVLIDDSDANIDRFADAGGQAVLIPRVWNSSHRCSHIDGGDVAEMMLGHILANCQW
jgi:5'(3')-deoxyribonucleotidase